MTVILDDPGLALGPDSDIQICLEDRCQAALPGIGAAGAPGTMALGAAPRSAATFGDVEPGRYQVTVTIDGTLTHLTSVAVVGSEDVTLVITADDRVQQPGGPSGSAEPSEGAGSGGSAGASGSGVLGASNGDTTGSDAGTSEASGTPGGAVGLPGTGAGASGSTTTSWLLAALLAVAAVVLTAGSMRRRAR